MVKTYTFGSTQKCNKAEMIVGCINVSFNRFLVSFSSQLEIDNGDELTSDFLYEEVHPKQHAHKQAFAKPKGPIGKKGGRRITRPPGDGADDD